MQKIIRRLFERRFGAPPATVLPLEGDGSNRAMYRVVGQGMETAIAVVGPDADENRAFLSYSASFRGIGLPVPEIYGVDERAAIYLEEDLGDTTLFDAIAAARKADPEAAFPASLVPMLSTFFLA